MASKAAADAAPSVVCWGCGEALTVSATGEEEEEVEVACAYCGAISEFPSPDISVRRAPSRSAGNGAGRGRGTVQGGAWRRPPSRSSSSLVLLVLFLVLSVVCASALLLLRAPRSPFGVADTVVAWMSWVLLPFNTLYNYWMTVFRCPGYADHLPFGDKQKVQALALQRCRFCHLCAGPKPAGAHHCRSCGRCVELKDHHCPLVGNCVGMHNRRHFLAFLFWSEVYAMYTLAFGLTRLPALQALFGSGSADAAPDGASRYEAALVCYLLGSATVVLSFVGFVLFTEMMLLRRGKTYVGDLKYADEDSEQEVSMAAAYRRLRTLFLGEPAWTWPFTWFPATPPCAGARSNALWCTSPMDKES
eukprot:TRINITY_DN11239_c0_g2_i1.p1 TRINITY_DN11239_c0_g2~~TRINITY_DN11239_c0_g2_i1.p1  ORF type:complete len:361 (+),score=70.55 TRINITY_DN11239_c0_g2_i1:89-1171(+)